MIRFFIIFGIWAFVVVTTAVTTGLLHTGAVIAFGAGAVMGPIGLFIGFLVADWRQP